MSLKSKTWIYPYLLLTPALLIILLVVFIPIVRAVINSFMYFDLRYPNRTAFIGLKNYIDIFTQDLQFWPSLGRTLVWVIFGVGLQFLFGFILALILNRTFKGRELKLRKLMIHKT